MTLAETLLPAGTFWSTWTASVPTGWRRCLPLPLLPPIASLARRFGDTEVAGSRRAVIEWLTP